MAPPTPPRYMCMTCHDLACNCRLPQTVRQYKGNILRNATFGPTVYERTYVTPPNYTWSRRKGAQQVISTEKSPWKKAIQDRPETEPAAEEGGDKTGDDKDADVVPFNYFFWEFGNSPALARRPFLVSSPHWASRGHLQQWPWRGKTHCKLWSSGSQFNLASSGRHRLSCWSNNHTFK